MLCLFSCNDDDSFDNKAYNSSTSSTSDVLIRRGTTTAERYLQASMAKVEGNNIIIRYKVDTSLLDRYNSLYDQEAVILPTANYEILDPEATISAGSITSSEVLVSFKNLDLLDPSITYVLPVSIDNSSSIGILDSKRTTYFVIKEAALINSVADIEKNYLSINWKKSAVCDNLTMFTMESLIRVRDYSRLINSVMGIEGYFLIRIGDSGFPSNQIQVATKNGNYPNADSSKGLPTNEWTHVAVTYDSNNDSLKIYVNGEVQSKVKTGNIGALSFATRPNANDYIFHIGRSYDDNRALDGEIAECRIWNTVRTKEQIANNPYYVDPNSPGLVAYWKFDDANGNTVKDYTANGNNATAQNALKWVSVSLPEK